MLKSKISSGFRVQGSGFFVMGILLFFSMLSFSFAQEVFKYDAQGKRDPFIPLVTSSGVLLKLDKDEKKAGVELIIEGIIYDKQGSSYAIVDANVVRVGDPVADGYRVLKIEEDKVIFIKEGELKEVRLNKEE
jgi:hypothetical protein